MKLKLICALACALALPACTAVVEPIGAPYYAVPVYRPYVYQPPVRYIAPPPVVVHRHHYHVHRFYHRH